MGNPFTPSVLSWLKNRAATPSQGAHADEAFGWGDHALAGYASGAQGAKADTAFSWGNHASEGYASTVQGTRADTAFGWGNHALAGYVTYSPLLRKSTQTGIIGVTLTLPQTPVSVVQVHKNAVLLQETVDYTIAAAVITFVVPLIAGDLVQVLYQA